MVRFVSVIHNICIVAKQVLSKICLKKQIGLPDRYPLVTIWTLQPPIVLKRVLIAPPNTCIANCDQTALVSIMVTIDSL